VAENQGAVTMYRVRRVPGECATAVADSDFPIAAEGREAAAAQEANLSGIGTKDAGEIAAGAGQPDDAVGEGEQTAAQGPGIVQNEQTAVDVRVAGALSRRRQDERARSGLDQALTARSDRHL